MSTSSTAFFSESNKKGEVSELKKSLQSPEVQRDASQYKKVIQKVISCMTLGMDLSSIFMDMIKVMLLFSFSFVQHKTYYGNLNTEMLYLNLFLNLFFSTSFGIEYPLPLRISDDPRWGVGTCICCGSNFCLV